MIILSLPVLCVNWYYGTIIYMKKGGDFMLWFIMSVVAYGTLYVGVPVIVYFTVKRGITK